MVDANVSFGIPDSNGLVKGARRAHFPEREQQRIEHRTFRVVLTLGSASQIQMILSSDLETMYRRRESKQLSTVVGIQD